MSKLIELAEMCEKASEGSPALDIDIAMATGLAPGHAKTVRGVAVWFVDNQVKTLELQPWSSSLDAAVSLCERVLPQGGWQVRKMVTASGNVRSQAVYLGPPDADDAFASGSSPALALVAATLRALAKQES